MDLDLYYYFYVVCNSESFSDAAKKLFVTQPAISYAMKKLEQKLGRTLFEKGTKKLYLTPDGEDLLTKIKPQIKIMEEIENNYSISNKDKSYKIRIGAPTQIARSIILDKIMLLKKMKPNYIFSVFCGSSNYLMNMLSDGDIDVLIDCDPIEINSKNILKERICKQEYVIISNKNCKNNSLSIMDFLKGPLIVPGEYSNCVKTLKKFFSDLGYEIFPDFYFTTTDLVEEYVKLYGGFGVVLKEEVRDKEIKILETDIHLPKYSVYKLWKANPPRYVNDFLRMLNSDYK